MTRSWHRWQEEVLLLDCYLKPRARTDAVLGLHDDRLHVQVRTAPMDGQANAALCALLATAFALPKSRAELRIGAGCRHKTVALHEPRQQPDWFVRLGRN